MINTTNHFYENTIVNYAKGFSKYMIVFWNIRLCLCVRKYVIPLKLIQQRLMYSAILKLKPFTKFAEQSSF